jgi:succinate dehydrogenase / fumarate reductase cytochrome b subunit
MAVTGLLLVAFLLAHMLGNLKIFFGQQTFDHYAHWIRTIGTPALPHTWFLWIQRFGLTMALFAHFGSAWVLARRAKRARPVKYVHRPPVQGSYAARTMRWGGVIVLLFIVYHLLDLSAGTLNPKGEAGHPYANVVADFRPGHWYIALAYAISILAVGFHLRHGIYSALRTLGQRTARGEQMAKGFALGFSVFLCAGFLAVPFFVLVGVVG